LNLALKSCSFCAAGKDDRKEPARNAKCLPSWNAFLSPCQMTQAIATQPVEQNLVSYELHCNHELSEEHQEVVRMVALHHALELRFEVILPEKKRNRKFLIDMFVAATRHKKIHKDTHAISGVH
jgi:hypothetical protein